MAEMPLAERFNRPGHEIVNHRTWVFASDGDLMEGVSSEAASLAGHLALGKLTVLYDDNHITIDGDTDRTFNEEVAPVRGIRVAGDRGGRRQRSRGNRPGICRSGEPFRPPHADSAPHHHRLPRSDATGHREGPRRGARGRRSRQDQGDSRLARGAGFLHSAGSRRGARDHREAGSRAPRGVGAGGSKTIEPSIPISLGNSTTRWLADSRSTGTKCFPRFPPGPHSPPVRPRRPLQALVTPVPTWPAAPPTSREARGRFSKG